MNVTELARILRVTPNELLDKLPQLGFDIGRKAIKIDNSVANRIIREWPKFAKKIELKKEGDIKMSPNLENNVLDKKKISIPNFITARDFAILAGLPVNKILSELMKNGIFVSLNQKLDFETAAIISDDLGLEVNLSEENKDAKVENIVNIKSIIEAEDKDKLLPRPPVIVVMGHVDHGKTKLLDAIRKSNVVDSEFGGITQHIGAYQVDRQNKTITFIDTPGHEAFTAMRSRGAKIADAAILVVAADDGVMPQTVEAYRIIEAAKIPFIVAINKIDKPEANIEKTKKNLSEKLNITPEDWGGKIICVPVSAKEGKGINEILDTILLVADIESENLKFNKDALAVGTVIESHVDKSEGPLATILVQNGTLRIGDQLCMNNIIYGKVRALKNYRGEDIKEAASSVPAKILGLKIAPEVGDILQVGLGEKIKTKKIKFIDKFSHNNIIKEEENENIKKINVIIKSDVLGSLEAISESLEKINNQYVKINILHKGLGNITDGDIKRAESSNGKIIGFNVKTSPQIEEIAREKKVIIKMYNVIYNLINDLKEEIESLIGLDETRVETGKMKVKAIFRTENKSQIIGGVVIQGQIEKDNFVEVIRNNEIIAAGKINGLQCAKQSVGEVPEGQECGINYEGKPVVKENDILSFYKIERISKKI